MDDPDGSTSTSLIDYESTLCDKCDFVGIECTCGAIGREEQVEATPPHR